MKKSLIAFALVLIASPVWAAGPVTLRAETELNRPTIYLSDVFDGLAKGADKEIAISPEAGKSVTYNVSVLKKLASQYSLEWEPQSIADQTVLTRAATRITPEMISKVVEQRIKQAASKDISGVEISFDRSMPQINLPADRTPDFALSNFAYDTQTRRFRGEIVAQNGNQPAHYPLSGRAILKKQVPVLIRRLASGTTISPHDVTWKEVSEDQITNDVLASVNDLVGLELRRDQGEGEFLRSRDVVPPRLVTRGSLVTLKIETPFMLITAQGRAMQDGTKGEVVRVTNVQSNRVIEGTVEAGGTVRVGALRQMAAVE